MALYEDHGATVLAQNFPATCGISSCVSDSEKHCNSLAVTVLVLLATFDHIRQRILCDARNEWCRSDATYWCPPCEVCHKISRSIDVQAEHGCRLNGRP